MAFIRRKKASTLYQALAADNEKARIARNKKDKAEGKKKPRQPEKVSAAPEAAKQS